MDKLYVTLLYTPFVLADGCPFLPLPMLLLIDDHDHDDIAISVSPPIHSHSKAIFHHGSPKQQAQDSSSSSQQQQNQASAAGSSSSAAAASSRHSKDRSRDAVTSPTSSISKASATRQHQPIHAAPSKAQAAMAAYNPEPHRQSEAQGFVGHNPAQQPMGHVQGSGVVSGGALNVNNYNDNGNNRVPKVSPGLAAGTSQNVPGEDTRAKAEKMVNAEREARGRLPVYEGMPEYFQLESKMGE